MNCSRALGLWGVIAAASLLGCQKNAPPPPSAPALVETLGIETAGDVLTPIFPAGTPLPASFTERFSTAEDFQPTFQLRLVSGSGNKAGQARTVLNLVLPLEKPGKRAEPQIDLTLKVDAKGQLTVHAQEAGASTSIDRSDLSMAVTP